MTDNPVQPDATLTTRQTRAATLEAMGHTTDDIARTMGVHRATVFRWRKSERYRALVATLDRDAQAVARTRLERSAIDAADKLATLLDSTDERVQLRTALAILDRTGHGPGQRVELQAAAVSTVERVDPVEELTRLMLGGAVA